MFLARNFKSSEFRQQKELIQVFLLHPAAGHLHGKSSGTVIKLNLQQLVQLLSCLQGIQATKNSFSILLFISLSEDFSKPQT